MNALLSRFGFRRAMLLLALCGAAGTAASFFSQYVLHLNPCPLCILQRVAVMSVMLAAGLCALFPCRSAGAKTAAACFVSLPAVWGWATAAYQIWLQSLPPEEQPSCGAPWTFRLHDWPGFSLWEPVVRGFGNCGVREYLLGIPLPVWSIVFFSFALAAVWTAKIRLHRPAGR